MTFFFFWQTVLQVIEFHTMSKIPNKSFLKTFKKIMCQCIIMLQISVDAFKAFY